MVGQIFPFSLIRSFSVLHFRVHVFPLLFFLSVKLKTFSLSLRFDSPPFTDIRQSATVNMRNGGMKEYMYFEECNELWAVVVHSFFIEPIFNSIWNVRPN